MKECILYIKLVEVILLGRGKRKDGSQGGYLCHRGERAKEIYSLNLDEALGN